MRIAPKFIKNFLLSFLEDVDISGPVDGDGFIYSDVSNKWENKFIVNSDHHSGYEFIDTNQAVLVAQFKQMVNFNGLKVEGELYLEGGLILE